MNVSPAQKSPIPRQLGDGLVPYPKDKGFTLIEILVTVVIISVLSAIGIVSYVSVNQRSRDAKRKNDIEQLRSAIELYRADNGYYPDENSGAWTDVDNLATDLVSTYMPLIPQDPDSAEAYFYQATDANGTPTQYYGYCLSAKLESEDPTDSCTPYAVGTHTYGVKNP